jgi:hypothetical protein
MKFTIRGVRQECCLLALSLKTYTKAHLKIMMAEELDDIEEEALLKYCENHRQPAYVAATETLLQIDQWMD